MASWVGVLVLVVLWSVLGVLAFWFMGGGKGAPFLPVRQKDIRDFLSLVPVGEADVVVDMGCGDGRVLCAAAERGARVVGYEVNPILAGIARWRLRRFGDRAVVYRRNFFDANLQEATIVTAFALGTIMPKIVDLLDVTTQKHVTFVSFVFRAPRWREIGSKGQVRVYTRPS